MRIGKNRLLALDSFHAVQTIMEAELADIGFAEGVAEEGFSFYPQDVIGRGDPKPAEMIFGDLPLMIEFGV